MSKEKQIEKNCNECVHFEACCKWTDFPKQIGFPTCRKFAPISGYRKQSEWIEGYFEKYIGCAYINLQTERLNSGGYPIREFVEVIPETVGQYTGLTDKNGKKIFDGDILVFCKGATYPIKVYWDGLGWKFLRNGKNIKDAFECNTIHHIRFCEIIGNIHDNSELL